MHQTLLLLKAQMGLMEHTVPVWTQPVPLLEYHRVGRVNELCESQRRGPRPVSTARGPSCTTLKRRHEDVNQMTIESRPTLPICPRQRIGRSQRLRPPRHGVPTMTVPLIVHAGYA